MNRNLFAAIIVAVGCVLFFVLVLPELDNISGIQDVIKSKQALLDERTAELATYKSLVQQAQLHQADINKITVFVPPTKQAAELLSSIQTAASNAGIQLTSMTSAPVISGTETRYQQMFIGLDLIGQHTSFVNFLALLEQNLRLFDITDISGSVTGGQATAVNFSLKMYAYYLKK